MSLFQNYEDVSHISGNKLFVLFFLFSFLDFHKLYIGSFDDVP